MAQVGTRPGKGVKKSQEISTGGRQGNAAPKKNNDLPGGYNIYNCEWGGKTYLYTLGPQKPWNMKVLNPQYMGYNL